METTTGGTRPKDQARAAEIAPNYAGMPHFQRFRDDLMAVVAMIDAGDWKALGATAVEWSKPGDELPWRRWATGQMHHDMGTSRAAERAMKGEEAKKPERPWAGSPHLSVHRVLGAWREVYGENVRVEWSTLAWPSNHLRDALEVPPGQEYRVQHIIQNMDRAQDLHGWRLKLERGGPGHIVSVTMTGDEVDVPPVPESEEGRALYARIMQRANDIRGLYVTHEAVTQAYYNAWHSIMSEEAALLADKGGLKAARKRMFDLNLAGWGHSP